MDGYKRMRGFGIAVMGGVIIGALLFRGKSEIKPIIQEKIVYRDRCIKESPVAQPKCEQKSDDKLYANVFIMFLASLGIEINDNLKAEVAKLVKDPKNYKAPMKEEAQPLVNESKKGTEFEYLKRNQKLMRLYKDFFPDESNSHARLGIKSILSDPISSYAASYSSNHPKDVLKYNGHYLGELYFIKGSHKGQIHKVDLNFNFQVKNSKNVEGSFTINLTDTEGKVYSSNRGSGGNKAIRISKDRKQLILEVSPDSFFHFSKNRLTVPGNYYRDGKHVGFVTINRQ